MSERIEAWGPQGSIPQFFYFQSVALDWCSYWPYNAIAVHGCPAQASLPCFTASRLKEFCLMDRITHRPHRYQIMFGTTAVAVASFLIFVFGMLGIFGLIEIFAGG